MSRIMLFEAKHGAVTVTDKELDVAVIVRDDLTKDQAIVLANRLNNEARTTEFKPTRREQKFTVHFEGDFEVTSFEDLDEDDFYSVSQLKDEVDASLVSTLDDSVDNGSVDKLKVKVTVKKVYDKQVPND